eukprot:2928396-Pleurochrysis_carterae.AAC.4
MCHPVLFHAHVNVSSRDHPLPRFDRTDNGRSLGASTRGSSSGGYRAHLHAAGLATHAPRSLCL